MSAETNKPEVKTEVKKVDEAPKIVEPKTEVKNEPRPEVKTEPKEEKPKFEVTDFNPWDVLKYPHLTEKSMNMVELENKLVFVADIKANKAEIKEAIERGFNVKVEAINLEITQKGLKKVYATLDSNSDATDIASKLGML